jgi:hypothetical protein
MSSQGSRSESSGEYENEEDQDDEKEEGECVSDTNVNHAIDSSQNDPDEENGRSS